MTATQEFIYLSCQRGAENALKADFAVHRPTFRLAFSRPGFLTFKGPQATALAQAGQLDHPLARTCGVSLGRAALSRGGDGEASPEIIHRRLAEQVWSLAADVRCDRLHVWQRDSAVIGHFGFKPSIAAPSLEADAELRAASPWPHIAAGRLPTQPGQCVLDVVIVEPSEWWIGWRLARSPQSCWPGGIPPLEEPAQMTSRAWLKMREALLWSEFALAPGDRWAEIGCAPGGASQALLELDQSVIGIDPASVAPQVAGHPRFTHLRKRGAEVRRREFRGVRFLAADLNVAPSYTLDAVEGIVTHPEVHIGGLLLTLKLLDWGLFSQLPEYLARVRSWGYSRVQARQLCFNRQELCVAAARDDSVLERPGPAAQRRQTGRAVAPASRRAASSPRRSGRRRLAADSPSQGAPRPQTQ